MESRAGFFRGSNDTEKLGDVGISSRELTYPQGTFESMIFPFPRWDMLVSWRVHTVDGRNPAPVEVGSLSHYLQGFNNIPGGWEWDFFHQQ